MTVHKQPILPHLIRQVPEQFSWIDQRLVREHYIDQLSHQASALYLFLVTVGDSRGLSYYGDTTLGQRLNMDSLCLQQARDTLVRHRLVAYRKPIYQVLALNCRRESVQADSEPASIGQILQPTGRRCAMIDYEQFCRIKAYREEGLKAGQIASKLGLDPRTVSKWMDSKGFQPRLPGCRPSKLDPYKNEILGMLERHPYSAMQIFQKIQEQGFDGGYTIVKDYVRRVRPKRHKPYLKLSFAPGECGQVDWGSYGSIGVGSTRRRLSFFVMVLCHSRMMYVEFTVSQTMEHFLGCHQRALQYFGGVPSRIRSTTSSRRY